MNYIEIGTRIKEAIKKKGFKQKFVAESIGISEDSMVNYIKGRREISIENLKEIAHLCDVPFEYLINGDQKGTLEASKELSQSYSITQIAGLKELLQHYVDTNDFEKVAKITSVLIYIEEMKAENERIQKKLQELKKQNSEIQSGSLEKGLSTSV